VADGLILLAFLGLLIAVLLGRARRRLGLAVTVRMLALTVVIFVIAVLILWATQR
jgi:hypothetical protein